MKKIYKLLFLFILVSCFDNINAQVSGYSFTSSAGTYVPITGGTNLPSTVTAFLDDNSSVLSNIGFTFTFNGTPYTQFGFNANGFITLGAVSVTSNTSLSSGSSNNVISALNNDLIGRGSVVINRTSGSPIVTVTGGDINLVSIGDAVTGTGVVTGSTVISKTATTLTLSANASTSGTGSHLRYAGPSFGIRYETIGSMPNRSLVVQWTGFQRYTTTGGFGELYNFQIILTETSNTISNVYNILGPTSTTSNTYQIGLRGSSSSDFNNRTTTTNWSATTAGGTNAATVTLSNTVFPTSGLTYLWTPPFCIAPTVLTATNITGTTATIGWTASGSASSYDWELRTTGSCGSGSPVQSGNTLSNSVNLTSLTANTTYTYCVRSACTGPTESGWVSGTFTTSCSTTAPPYTQDFESVTTPAIPACTSIQNAGTGNNWTTNSPSNYGFTSKALRYSYNSSNAANAWFFTQGLTLTTGTTYKLTYKYGSAGFDESLKVNIGTSPSAAAMITNLADHPLVTTSPLTNTVYFTVPSNDTYYVGYNAYSIADQFYLFVDDINIIVAPTCDGPSGIVASAITQNSATISWTAPAPPPASGYDYIYSTSSTPPTGMSTPSGSTGAGITTTNLTSLTSSTLYYVWVRSVCSGVDKSNWVAMPSFTTSVDCSTAPVLSCATPVTSGNLAVAGGLLNDGTCGFSTPGNEKLYSFTSTTAGSYTLNITNVNGGFGYIDYQFKLASAGCGAGGWTCIGDRSSVGTTTFTLAAATQYFILLDAESASSTANHTFQIDCPVACPAPISAAATGITTNSANANWTPTSGDFIIEYGPTSTFGTPGTGATAGNVNNFVVTATNVGTKALLGLISSTGYSYVIRLDCTGAGNGYSANSTVRTFTTTGTPPANDECIDAINLTPTPGYFTNPGLQNMANSLPTTVTASCVTTTNNKQDVWYKLTSDNDGNMGEHINLTVTPTGTSDFAIMLYGGSCGILTELDCADDFGGGSSETIVYTEVPFTGENIETRDNIVYYLRVLDYFNSNGQFNISALGSTALPVNILSFDAKSLNNKTVQLTWNVAAEVDVKEYVVERSNDNRNWSAIGSVKANQKSTYGFNDNSPVSGVNYYRLAVKDVNASVAYSDIRTVNFSGKGNMALYPNPANNTLYVSGTDDKNVVVSIYNEVGQIVNTLSSNGETIRTGGIDVSQLLPGAYSIQVKGESGLTTMRFVKQ